MPKAMKTSTATAPLSAMDDDKRNFDRIEGTLAGTLFVDNVPHQCIVMNISPGGARIKCARAMALDMSVRLYVEGFGSFEACVIRSKDGELGLLFLCKDAKRF